MTVTDLARSEAWYTKVLGVAAGPRRGHRSVPAHRLPARRHAVRAARLPRPRPARSRSTSAGPASTTSRSAARAATSSSSGPPASTSSASPTASIVDAGYGSGLSFRDPDNIALELFAPPGVIRSWRRPTHTCAGQRRIGPVPAQRRSTRLVRLGDQRAAAAFGVERLAGPLELLGGGLHPLRRRRGVAARRPRRTACASATPASHDVPCHSTRRPLGDRRGGAGRSARSPARTQAIVAGHRQHDRAEQAGVVPAERRLGAVDDRRGPRAGRRRRGSSCRRCAAAGAWRSSTSAPAAAPAAAAASPPRRRPRRRAPRRGAAASAPRRPPSRGRGAGRRLRSARRRRASRSPESSAASPISADANAAARSAPLRRAVVCRSRATLDDLGVRRRPVQHVLGRAEVAVEDRRWRSPGSRACAAARGASGRTSCPSGARAGPAARRGRAPSSRARRRAPAAAPRRPPPARPSKSEVKNAYLPRASRMSASSAPPSVLEAVERGRRGLEVARHHRAAGEPDPQPADGRRVGAVERLAVRRRGHRVADRVQQVAAQRQRGRPVRRRWRAVGPRRPAPARRGRRRPPPRSRRRAAGTARRRRRRPTASRWWPMRAAEALQLDQPARRRRGGSGAGGAAARRRAARRARGRGGTGSRRSPARRSARRARASRWSNASSSGSPDSATNSSVSNDEPTTATRCSTSRVAGAMPPIMLASSACTHRGSLAARRASSFTANGMPRPSAAICSTSSAVGLGDVAARRAPRRRRRRAGRARARSRRAGRCRLWRVSASVSVIGAGRWVSTMHTRWSRVERAM